MHKIVAKPTNCILCPTNVGLLVPDHEITQEGPSYPTLYQLKHSRSLALCACKEMSPGFLRDRSPGQLQFFYQ